MNRLWYRRELFLEKWNSGKSIESRNVSETFLRFMEIGEKLRDFLQVKIFMSWEKSMWKSSNLCSKCTCDINVHFLLFSIFSVQFSKINIQNILIFLNNSREIFEKQNCPFVPKLKKKLKKLRKNQNLFEHLPK